MNNNNNNNNSKQNECNCKTQNNCPMNGLCKVNNVAYQEIIYPKENVKDKKNLYRNFLHKMERYTNHKFSFSHEHMKHQTALSKQFWSLKNKG